MLIRNMSQSISRMEFIYTETAEKTFDKYLSDDEVLEIEGHLISRPDHGDLIQGGDGLRKLRFKYRGKGARGGIRLIYYWVVSDSIIFACVYPKSKQSNISANELIELVRQKEQVRRIISP